MKASAVNLGSTWGEAGVKQQRVPHLAQVAAPLAELGIEPLGHGVVAQVEVEAATFESSLSCFSFKR